MSLDFVSLARDHNLPYLESGHHHCARGWVQTHCPLCSDGRSGYHLGVNLESGKAACWRCGGVSVGSVLKLLLPGKNVTELLSRYARVTSTTPKSTEAARATSLAYPEFITDLAPPHRNYLSARGFDPDNLIRTWSIKGVGSDGGRWSWRVVIPILDRFGTMQSYTGRAIGILVKPRYLTLDLEHSLTNPKHLLYGEHLATDQVIIVEGPTDVWRFGPGAVATLGSSWTLEQAKKLSRFKRRYIMFDNEHTAQKLAAALASQLSPFPGETEIITGLESDPGELEHYRVQRIRRWLGFWPAG